MWAQAQAYSPCLPFKRVPPRLVLGDWCGGWLVGWLAGFLWAGWLVVGLFWVVLLLLQPLAFPTLFSRPSLFRLSTPLLSSPFLSPPLLFLPFSPII